MEKFRMINASKDKLVICTTTPDAIMYILKGQPKYLKDFFEVIIITGYSENNKNIELNEDVKVYSIAFKRNINLFYDLLALFQMLFLLLLIKPKIIHSYTPKAGLISMWASKILKVPIRIHTFTGLIFPTKYGLMKDLLIFFDRFISFCATKVIPEGVGVKNDLISHRITNKKLNIIGNGNISGIDTNYFSSFEINYDDALYKLKLCGKRLTGKTVFCFIGRLNEDKGLSELYNAFVTLNDNYFLLIAGDLDIDGNSISLQLYHKMKSNKRIIFLGFVNDVRLVLKVSKILVLPSYREGFPNVLLQSLSMNVPAIATNINGCNEIIIHNYNGWLIEPHNSNELANKMEYAASIDSSTFEKIVFNTRNSIVSRFEQSVYRENLVKEYFSLIN